MVELLKHPEDYTKITVILDDDGFVTSWGTTMSSDDEHTEDLVLPNDHDFLNNPNSFSFRFEEGDLVYVQDKHVFFAQRDRLHELNFECSDAILAGFDYEIDGVKYHASYSDYKQRRFEECTRLFSLQLMSEVDWEFEKDGEIVNVCLKEHDFYSLSVFASIVKQNKMDKYLIDLTNKVKEAKTVEEVVAVTWDCIPDPPYPEKPQIDLEVNGLVNKGDFNKLDTKNLNLTATVAELSDLVFMLLG